MTEAYERLEYEFATKFELNPVCCVAVASGTAALHVAFETLRASTEHANIIQAVMSDFSMIACPRAAVMAGLDVCTVDIGRSTLNLDINALAAAEEARGRFGADSVLLAVHAYGRSVEDEVFLFAKDRGMPVIEDLAEAHGLNPRPDSFAGCWSFYKNKIIHGEEGGMICFKDHRDATLARKLRSHGFTDDHDFRHIPRGVNARMSNAHASLILDSLQVYGSEVIGRARVKRIYEEIVPEKFQLLPRERKVYYLPWVFPMTIGNSVTEIPFSTGNLFSATVDELLRYARTIGLGEMRVGFKRVSDQPEFNQNQGLGFRGCNVVDDTPNAHQAANTVFYLPLWCPVEYSNSRGVMIELPDDVVRNRVQGLVDKTLQAIRGIGLTT